MYILNGIVPAQNPAVEPSEADGHPISNLGGNEKTTTLDFAKKNGEGKNYFWGYRCTLSMKYHTPDVMDRLSPALTNDLGHENKEGYDKDNGKCKDQNANINTNPLGT